MSSDNSEISTASIVALAAGAGLQWCEGANADLLAKSLSATIASRLNNAIKRDGKASLVVSGGSTPAPVFAQLARARIDWSKVAVTLADERWVAPGHPDSNESLVRNTLLIGNAAAARFVSLYRTGLSPEQAIKPVSDDLKRMPTPFTVVILGMGGDGHTASLFPDAPVHELAPAMSLDSDDWVAIMHPASVSQSRITLTRRCLLRAEQRFVHITGTQKRDVLIQALATSLDGSSFAPYTHGQAPIVGLVTENPASVSIYWSE